MVEYRNPVKREIDEEEESELMNWIGSDRQRDKSDTWKGVNVVV